MAYITETELQEMGFKSVGKDVYISTRAAFYGVSNISIGDNVRIDDFCLLSAVGGFIDIKNHIHISPYVSIFGRGGVTLEDFSNLSSYTCLYSASDDYKGDYLIGATMDEDLRNVIIKPVVIGKYCTCGSHAVVLPGVTLHEGSILGASSLAVKSLDAWNTYSGIPAKIIKERKKGLIEKAVLMEKRRQDRKG
jgi:acetyltransferase-like isoleucine patch superfamily enzyme